VFVVSTLKGVLKEIKKELEEKEKVRENAHDDMRKATSLSKQSILLIHQKKVSEAKKQIVRAREIISKLNEVSVKYPDVIYSGLFSAARQHFSVFC
jgi:predicted translin family RNA/ssDNA-binding protein